MPVSTRPAPFTVCPVKEGFVLTHATRVLTAGQPLRGRWRPRLRQRADDAHRVGKAKAETVSIHPKVGWWQRLLRSIGLIGPAREIPMTVETAPSSATTSGVQAKSDGPAYKPDCIDEDPAVSFWHEDTTASAGCLELYAPSECGTIVHAPMQIGRSFLGAYRKGRHAAAIGLTTADCPYKPKRQQNGRSVNALTRKFQQCWAEGINDAIAGRPERYA